MQFQILRSNFVAKLVS